MPARVLLVLPCVPYPLLSGGHLRDWQVLNVLNRLGIRPHVLFFSTAETRQLPDGSPVDGLAASLSYAGARNEHPDLSFASLLRRKLSYLMAHQPRSYPSSYQYDAIDAGAKIVEHATRVNADVVILRSFWCHHVEALHRVGCRVIADCPDYNTRLAWEMVRSVRNPVRKIGPLCNYAGVRKQERSFLPLCDEVWVPTREEADDVARIVPANRIVVLPNSVDADGYPDLSSLPCTAHSLLFVGNFEYLPNAHAADLLLRHVFPEVLRAVPDAQLFLVGRGLSTALRAKAAAFSSVQVTGFVDDLISYYRRAAVVVLPVREGAGMLFKVLEALCLGKATVGFRHSFRGVGSNGERCYLAVGCPEDMAREAAALLDDRQARVVLGSRARAFAQRDLSWQRGVAILRDASLLSTPIDA